MAEGIQNGMVAGSSGRKCDLPSALYAIVAFGQSVVSTVILESLSSGLKLLLQFRQALTTTSVSNFEQWVEYVPFASAGMIGLGVLLWAKRPQSLASYAVLSGLLWCAVFAYVVQMLFYQAGSIMLP